jgi:ABC-type Fe3+/spermidine/putrescine transport system ATPase subunit
VSIVNLHKVTKRFGNTVAVDTVSFEVQPRQIISLVGPSGCGKTTTLRLIAGFETPDEGAIKIGGVDLEGKRPFERNIGLLFQDYALFPHMTVEQNVAFGLRHRRFQRSGIAQRISEMLNLVKLQGLENRYPTQLSGGQQQRVALARALATQPEVMLLDEPLSALDAKLRQELRVELKEILDAVGSTTIVVTHDQQEAMSLSEHVILMNAGKIIQRGTPSEIYSQPTTKFVAEFIGQSNWFSGRLGEQVTGRFHKFYTKDGLELVVPSLAEDNVASCDVCIRPEHIEIVGNGPQWEKKSECNLLSGTIFDVSHLGSNLQLSIDLSVGKRIVVSENSNIQAKRRKGQNVQLQFVAEDCIVFST